MDTIRPNQIDRPGIFIPIEPGSEDPSLLEDGVQRKVQELGELGLETYHISLEPKEEIPLALQEEGERQSLGSTSVSAFRSELNALTTNGVSGRIISKLIKTHASVTPRYIEWENSAENRERLGKLTAQGLGKEDDRVMAVLDDIYEDLKHYAPAFYPSIEDYKPKDYERPLFYVRDAPYDYELHQDCSEDKITLDLDSLLAFAEAQAFTHSIGVGPKIRSLINEYLNSKLQASSYNPGGSTNE